MTRFVQLGTLSIVMAAYPNPIITPHSFEPTGRLTGWKYTVTSVGIYSTRVLGFNVEIVNRDCLVVARLRESGLLSLHEGFAWNGANWFPDIPSIMQGSAAHDALWQMLAEGQLPMSLRNETDAAFREINLASNMWPWLADVTHFAVNTFGVPSTTRKLN